MPRLRPLLQAVKLDYTDAEQIVSTMVDDVFFVLQKCTRRGLSTQHADCVCAVLNHANAILEEDFAQVLKKRLSGGLADLMANLLTLTGQGDLKEMFGQVQRKMDASSDDRVREYLVNLNNVETSQQYLTKLHDTILHEFDKVFAAQPDRCVSFHTCMSSGLTSGLHADSVLPVAAAQGAAKGRHVPGRHAQHSQGLPTDPRRRHREDVCPSPLHAHLQRRGAHAQCNVCRASAPLLGWAPVNLCLIVCCSYVLTDEELTYNDVNDPWAQEAVQGLNAMLAGLRVRYVPRPARCQTLCCGQGHLTTACCCLQAAMTDTSYDLCSRTFAAHLTTTVESFVPQLQFNQVMQGRRGVAGWVEARWTVLFAHCGPARVCAERRDPAG
jgi:hypothetical protein